MHFQDFHTSLKIRFIYDNPPVKTARTKQRLIQNFRPVGRRQNDNPLFPVKSIHLGKKLVQCLLPLLVTAAVFRITASANGVNLINKYDTGSVLLRLLEKISDTGCAHAHIQFNKIGTGKGKERHMCFSCHRLCQKRLTCTGRPH